VVHASIVSRPKRSSYHYNNHWPPPLTRSPTLSTTVYPAPSTNRQLSLKESLLVTIFGKFNIRSLIPAFVVDHKDGPPKTRNRLRRSPPPPKIAPVATVHKRLDASPSKKPLSISSAYAKFKATLLLHSHRRQDHVSNTNTASVNDTNKRTASPQLPEFGFSDLDVDLDVCAESPSLVHVEEIHLHTLSSASAGNEEPANIVEQICADSDHASSIEDSVCFEKDKSFFIEDDQRSHLGHCVDKCVRDLSTRTVDIDLDTDSDNGDDDLESQVSDDGSSIANVQTPIVLYKHDTSVVAKSDTTSNCDRFNQKNEQDDDITSTASIIGAETVPQEKEEIPSGTTSDLGNSHMSTTTTQTSNSSTDEELTRADWAPLKAISHGKFHRVLYQYVQGSDDDAVEDYFFVEEAQGSYNYVRLYSIISGPGAGTYVVKIPCVGTAARWQKQDADMLRSEFGTMKLIHERTKCPVPEVVAYDDTLDNVLGAPFIIMKASSGFMAGTIWFDRDSDGDEDYENADFPTEETHKKRTVFLQSLARAMSELQTLSFGKIGILDFDNLNTDGSPSIGPCWHWNMDAYETEEDLVGDKLLREDPVHEPSHDLFSTGLRKKWPHSDSDEMRVLSTRKIMGALFDLPPSRSPHNPATKRKLSSSGTTTSTSRTYFATPTPAK
jgi:hypothetical protein